MEIVIAIAAVILVGIQAQRNYLMIQAAKKPTVVVSDVKVELGEEYWPTVTVSNDIVNDIDYNKLSGAIKKALLESGVELHNAKLPVTGIPVVIPNPEPAPYWQSPIINEVTYEDGHTTTNVVEVNGVPGKQFPAR